MDRIEQSGDAATQDLPGGFHDLGPHSLLNGDEWMDSAPWQTPFPPVETEKTIAGGNGDDVLKGTSGNDVIYGDHRDDDPGSDTIYGEGGDDFLTDTGTDQLGNGNKVYGNDTLYGGDGNDLVQGEYGNNVLVGGAGDDTLTGGGGGVGGNNILTGGAGNDTLEGFGGQDTLIGGLGETSPSGIDTLNGGAGADQLWGDVYSRFGSGGVFNGATTMDGDEAFITAESGVTVVLDDVGAANTQYTIDVNQAAAGSIYNISKIYYDGSAAAVSNITGGAGDDVILGGAGADILTGGAGNDVVGGAGGDDTLSGGTGHDTLIGGAGNDTFLNPGSSLIVEGANGGTDTVVTTGSFSLVGVSQVENLQLTSDTDMAGAGNELNNQIVAAGGDDHLSGNAGDDRLFGGDGSDHLVGDNTSAPQGANSGDFLSGQDGDDFMRGSAHSDYIGEGGYDWAEVDAGLATAGVSIDFSHALATQGVFGFSGHEATIYLGGAATGFIDTCESLEFWGSNYADTVTGGPNKDILLGGAGADTLVGGGGADTLEGDSGTDSLTGGAGKDRFVYTKLADSGPSLAHADHILDFSRADGDKIDLQLLDHNLALQGDHAFFFSPGGEFTGKAGQLIALDQGGGVYLVEGDANGDGAADFLLSVTSAMALGAKDFIF